MGVETDNTQQAGGEAAPPPDVDWSAEHIGVAPIAGNTDTSRSATTDIPDTADQPGAKYVTAASFDSDGSINFLSNGGTGNVSQPEVLPAAAKRDEHSCTVEPGSKPVSRGIASIYPQREGTATGEVNDPNKFTAAHKTLPLNSEACVTRPGETQGTRVRINDRGPYVTGRVIDMTPVSARHLDPNFTIEGPGLRQVDVYSIKKKGN